MKIADEAIDIAAQTIASIEDTDGWRQWCDVAAAALEAAMPMIVGQALKDAADGLERELWMASEPGGYYEPVLDGEQQYAILTPASWVRAYGELTKKYIEYDEGVTSEKSA